MVLSSHDVLLLHNLSQAFFTCLHVRLHFFLVLALGLGLELW